MKSKHPYNTGNFRPLDQPCSPTACTFSGTLPAALANGMYVRNGGNPDPELSDDAPFHWFDGFGALTGVYFKQESESIIQPEFVAKWVVTDLYAEQQQDHKRRQGRPQRRLPVVPSIAVLIAPLSLYQLPFLLWSLLRAVLLVALSFLTPTPIRRISVANTAVLYHDGRALATCESGPPMRVALPSLDTVGWWSLEGDRPGEEEGLRTQAGGGWLGMAAEWTTAHPKRDNHTGELILYHSSFFPPYLKYSVIPSSFTPCLNTKTTTKRILAAPLPIPAARMMHDFAASRHHTVILDCPLSLDPLEMLQGRPTVNFAQGSDHRTRIGVFPRHAPDQVRWFHTPSCIVFHTANAWTSTDNSLVHLLCCRMNSSRMIYSAGNLQPPPSSHHAAAAAAEVCELYYYQLNMAQPPLSDEYGQATLAPQQAFSLSSIPFEFPEVAQLERMDAARYVYGCTLRNGTFSAALGKASKIDCLVKMDVLALIAQGQQRGLQGGDVVDRRTVAQVLDQQRPRTAEDQGDGSIRIFALPEHHFAQECSFVPRQASQERPRRGPDDGYLLFYVFDERQLNALTGEPTPQCRSELWIVDAWDLSTVVGRVQLPQRVPYGLHGEWFSAADIASQRPVKEMRTVDQVTQLAQSSSKSHASSWFDPLVSLLRTVLH